MAEHGEPYAKLRRPLAAALFIAALAAAGWRVPSPAVPGFIVPPPPPAAIPDAPFELSAVTGPMSVARSPSLVELPDRRLAAAWIAGRPDADDEEFIWLALRDPAGWQPARPVLGREATAGGSFVHISHLDTPVLYAEGGWLHLWYAGATVGTTLGRTLYHAVSTDGGRRWSPPRRLASSPLAASAALLGAPPLPLGDGGIGLPLAQDLIGRAGAWLRLSATGRVLDKQRLANEAGGLLPAVAPLDEQRALAILGHDQAAATPWQRSLSNDGGRSWQAGGALDFAATAGTPALLRLRSGRLLLAGNPPGGRQTMQLWLSEDDGQHWRATRSVETAADGNELSAPVLLQGRDGRIHLLYAGQWNGLRHARFDESWLEMR